MSKGKLERCHCCNSPCPPDEFVEVNIKAAATLCGLQRRTLLRRLEKKGYPLEPNTKHARLPLHIIVKVVSLRRMALILRELRREPLYHSGLAKMLGPVRLTLRSKVR